MPDWKNIENQLTSSLHLTRRPVAVSLCDEIPTDAPQFTGSVPAGCSFWKLAAEGQTFSTLAADHYNCPIGSYTHNIPLPPDREHELPDALQLMGSAGYIRMEEVGGIARLPETPAAVVYSPLSQTPGDPDTVLLVGRPGKLMLIQEAAIRAGYAQPNLLSGRPTCMAVPLSLEKGIVMSAGCIGNKIYTGLAEDEIYVAVRGNALPAIAAELKTITDANDALEQYHSARKQTLSSHAA